MSHWAFCARSRKEWYWRQCVMAAALSFASASLAESATAAPQLASPALAVKAGRQRGLTVMEKRRQEEEEQMAAAEAAAAKRKKILTPKPSVATVADPSLPAGVGIMGRGRAAVNAPLTSDESTVQALQQRRTSMPGCQTLSIGAVASWWTTRNHMVGAERVRMLIGSLGFADVDNFVSCDAAALRRHLARNQTATLAEEEVIVSAHRNFQQIAGAVGVSERSAQPTARRGESE